METRLCVRCGEEKPIEEFHLKNRKTGRRGTVCKKCHKAYCRQHYQENLPKYQIRAQVWHEVNYDRVRDYELRKKYGITLADYERLAAQQNYRCLGCGRLDAEVNRGLFVDHDHKTGRVRGLLCGRCNLLIGMIDDSPTILMALATYLTREDV